MHISCSTALSKTLATSVAETLHALCHLENNGSSSHSTHASPLHRRSTALRGELSAVGVSYSRCLLASLAVRVVAQRVIQSMHRAAPRVRATGPLSKASCSVHVRLVCSDNSTLLTNVHECVTTAQAVPEATRDRDRVAGREAALEVQWAASEAVCVPSSGVSTPEEAAASSSAPLEGAA